MYISYLYIVQYLETNSLLHESVKDMDLPTVEEVTIPPSDESMYHSYHTVIYVYNM